MSLPYHRESDYFSPNLISKTEETVQLGKYGRMRRDYLKEHRPGTYSELLLEGELNCHLAEVEETAYDYFDRLTSQMAKAENVTEALKAENQLEWVQRMNSIRTRANEIVLHDLVYA